MNKKVLIWIFFCLLFKVGYSNIGDTIKVQTFTFDYGIRPEWGQPRVGTFVIPDSLKNKTFSKILMRYTLKCDATQNPKCGEWDYLTYAILKEKTGVYDSITQSEKINKWELGRFITPYGYGLDLGVDGWTWTYDVSDFVTKLKDTIMLEAGNFQELLDLQFWFIEGTPSRQVLGIENVWQGDIKLQDFSAKVQEKKYKISQDVKMLKLRTCVTGHGMESTNNAWAEFSPNIHSVSVNSSIKWSWQIIQECANNPLYPQGGTWIYDRAGWCPGMPGKLQEFDLTPYIDGDSISIKYNIQYTSGGNYITESQIVKYGSPNFTNDASIENILTPSDDKLLSRENPSISKHKILIKNNGTSQLTTAIIKYHFEGGNEKQYTWNGNLGFLEEDTVYLPQLDWNEVQQDKGYFFAEILNPNGQVDEYQYNNIAKSSFVKAPQYSTNKIKLTYVTNHAPSQNKWIVEKANGEKLFESANDLLPNTQYTQVLEVPNGGYRLLVTDNNDDGLKFWANMPPNGSGTAGRTQISFYDTIFDYWNVDKLLQSDFGKEIEYQFIVNSFVGIRDVNYSTNEGVISVILYPNPTSTTTTIIVKGIENKTEAKIFDSQLREIDVIELNPVNREARQTINVSSYQKGVYYIQIQDSNTLGVQKLIII